MKLLANRRQDLFRTCAYTATVVALCMLLFAPTVASAQEASGITGIARDASGAVLPGVTVEASSPALIEKIRTVISDGDGRYSIVDLTRGSDTLDIPATQAGESHALHSSSQFCVIRPSDSRLSSS